MTDLRFPLPQRILARLEHEHGQTLDAMRVLAELSSWAANYTPDNDGFGSGSGGGPRSSDTTSTTERAALAGCSASEMERIVEGALAGYGQLLAAASRLSAYVTPRQRKPGRQSTLDVCPACDREMGPGTKLRILGGMCETDHRAWVREDRPDRAWFIRRRKHELEQQRQADEQQAKAARAGKAS